ncbi:MAG: NUDIX hydrolase [Nocardioidaceae bacterium]|nr:NUDIX hydrolase [Nocardioidaceae bacterium]MCL2612531.1 NUDIX hydrolase [Nocardioidaceae bacterium]
MRIPLPPVPLPEAVADVAKEYADGTRSAAEPRNAATVVLLRDAASGPEAYLLRRQLSMDFAGGMAVFPGGGVDPRDHALATELWAGPSLAEWADWLGVDETSALALVCAAVRETFEESGVLLAGPSAGEVVADTSGEDWEADRVALEARELSLTDFLTRRGLVLRTDLLGVWAGWLTPVFEPKRYRTWFFVARLPTGQVTRDVSTESSSVTWLAVGEAADRADEGSLAMLPPTYITCLEIAQHPTVSDVLGAAVGRRVEMFMPQVEPLGEGWTLSMPATARPLVAARRGLDRVDAVGGVDEPGRP